MKYSAPTPLKPFHNITDFDCGQPLLNDWLREKAYENELKGASRTYVVCYNNKVIAYYSLATGSITRNIAHGSIRRNMPEPIPVMVLGRLAVDINYQGSGIGFGLVKDAVLRTLQASEIAGIRAILVHALDESAKQFYQNKCGFKVSPVNPLTLMVTLNEVKKRLNL
ncbi:GNAT family N-acetyltransferase [Cyanobacterium sp. Dongsha4]|uniref:GNAT family N-acetyltransferase n=1 Tax=Cyanobacterium sp. DS4 TaxID=2878255 RepID=UPI002E800066|nr:GNAT family N-acetyltransferase [Cyanobacterium sp. Dongsha4]WVK99139.1 GNAT family N-acetyltransferase [Cyanobacterium sp. Dongsha4]